MENLRKYTDTQSVLMYVVANGLNPRSLGVTVNKPKQGISTSAWFVLTFSKPISEELVKALGGDRDRAAQLAETQEVRVVGQHLLPRIKTLLTGKEGEELYAKLTNYLDGEVVTSEEASTLLNAFIGLIKANELCISLMTELTEDGELLAAKRVAHLRGSGASASTTNIDW